MLGGLLSGFTAVLVGAVLVLFREVMRLRERLARTEQRLNDYFGSHNSRDKERG